MAHIHGDDSMSALIETTHILNRTKLRTTETVDNSMSALIESTKSGSTSAFCCKLTTSSSPRRHHRHCHRPNLPFPKTWKIEIFAYKYLPGNIMRDRIENFGKFYMRRNIFRDRFSVQTLHSFLRKDWEHPPTFGTYLCTFLHTGISVVIIFSFRYENPISDSASSANATCAYRPRCRYREHPFSFACHFCTFLYTMNVPVPLFNVSLGIRFIMLPGNLGRSDYGNIGRIST